MNGLELVTVLKVQEATQYGVPVLKPANELATMVCELAGTKTLTQTSVQTLKRYGYRIEVLPKAGRTL